MKRGITGSLWSLTPNTYTTVSENSHIMTLALMDSANLNRLDLSSVLMGFAGNHVRFPVNIPKRYSVQDAQIMLKSRSARKMFEHHPGFRKRYPRGWFWNGYEHYESSGWIDLDKSSAYCRSQMQHHGVTVIDDRQQRLPN